MGWIGPVTPPGDLDLVLGVPCSRYAACPCCFKSRCETGPIQADRGGAHRTEGVRLPSVAALTPRGCVVPAAPAVVCLNVRPALNRGPHGHDVCRPGAKVSSSLFRRQRGGIHAPMRPAPPSRPRVPNRESRSGDARHGERERENPPDLEPKWHQDQELPLHVSNPKVSLPNHPFILGR